MKLLWKYLANRIAICLQMNALENINATFLGTSTKHTGPYHQNCQIIFWIQMQFPINMHEAINTSSLFKQQEILDKFHDELLPHKLAESCTRSLAGEVTYCMGQEICRLTPNLACVKESLIAHAWQYQTDIIKCEVTLKSLHLWNELWFFVYLT